MSEQIKNPHVKTCENDPTNLDLHREQARQATLLEGLRDDVKEIKGVIIGSEKREGLIMDVDRLKRSRALFHAVLWVVFTTAIGTTATVLAAYFRS
jgi:hypothetical protein